MTRSVLRLAAALGALALATSCTATTTPTTTSTGATLNETFTALLTPNGALIFPFTETAAGTVTASLSTISPDSGLSLEMDLGTWNGSQCAIVISQNPSVQGSTVTGTANAAGSLCARVADANNTLTAAESITVTVSHF